MSAPRLVTRALVLSFLTVALMLGAVFTVLSVGVRDQVRQKAALDTWLTERAGASAVTTDELLMTVQREIDKIAGRVSASVLAVADGKGVVVVSGGRQASSWPRGSTIGAGRGGVVADRVVVAAIPLAARIVQVADAGDAMTSARAYRAARLPVEAIAELRRCAGTDFDGPAVEALVLAVPRLIGAMAPLDLSAFQWAPRTCTA